MRREPTDARDSEGSTVFVFTGRKITARQRDPCRAGRGGQLYPERRDPAARRPRVRVRFVARDRSVGRVYRSHAGNRGRILRAHQDDVAPVGGTWCEGMTKPLTVMIGASVGSWLALSAAGAGPYNPELALGMAGPLVSAVATWVIVERTQRAAPERVTSVMIAGFLVKLLAFGGYVALVGALGLRLRPFVFSLAGFFIALHLVEARYLGRLFAAARSVPSTLDAVES